MKQKLFYYLVMLEPVIMALIGCIAVMCILVMAEIQEGSSNAILHDIEHRSVYGVEVWYHPNGAIATIKL